MSTYTVMNIKGQCHSMTFVQGHSDLIFSNFFCSETATPIEAKFHIELPLDVGNENLSKCHMTMPIFGEKLQISFSSEPRGQ